MVAPTKAVFPVLSNGGATSTTSPPIKLSPFRPLRSCCASKVVIPPTSGVPVPGAKALVRLHQTKYKFFHPPRLFLLLQ